MLTCQVTNMLGVLAPLIDPGGVLQTTAGEEQSRATSWNGAGGTQPPPASSAGSRMLSSAWAHGGSGWRLAPMCTLPHSLRPLGKRAEGKQRAMEPSMRFTPRAWRSRHSIALEGLQKPSSPIPAPRWAQHRVGFRPPPSAHVLWLPAISRSVRTSQEHAWRSTSAICSAGLGQ
ncbi:hypothetical protein KIL84_011249 [Mauremys mutica]|uniref:Uncharacterized protein n=1 Tax=Mauremys mutica TaxID=74926 RepID=A0A9D3XCP2_9SAUR|nr:hypothetical protein KIL84_011249 [Mauremys mutica]